MDYTETDVDGNIRHYLDNEFYCETGPAIIYSNGSKRWYRHGKLHRLDGPAVEDVGDFC